MKLNLCPPCLIFYTDTRPDGFAGVANGPFIRICRDYKDDEGLLKHETQHCLQWWITLGLHSILYLLSKQYKLWAETSAYKRQLKYPPASLGDVEKYRSIYAEFIATRYNLNITQAEALRLLS